MDASVFSRGKLDKGEASREQACTRFGLSVWRISRLTRDETAKPVSRGQILRRERGQGKVYFPCSADHEQDWQPYPVDAQSAVCDDHKTIYARSRLARPNILRRER